MRFLSKLVHRVIRIVVFVFLALLVYGIAIIVFRQAYAIELPNVVRWVSRHWPSWLNLRF